MKTTKQEDQPGFALDKKNIVYIFIGLLILVVGYILLVGGGSQDPEVFNEKSLFSFSRVVLAPIVICAGFVFEIIAIIKIFKK